MELATQVTHHRGCRGDAANPGVPGAPSKRRAPPPLPPPLDLGTRSVLSTSARRPPALRAPGCHGAWPPGSWRRAKGWPAALAGNRTRVNCLEGSYAHHYTTNAAQPGPPPDARPGFGPGGACTLSGHRLWPPPPPPQRALALPDDDPPIHSAALLHGPAAAARRPTRASPTRLGRSVGPPACQPPLGGGAPPASPGPTAAPPPPFCRPGNPASEIRVPPPTRSPWAFSTECWRRPHPAPTDGPTHPRPTRPPRPASPRRVPPRPVPSPPSVPSPRPSRTGQRRITGEPRAAGHSSDALGTTEGPGWAVASPQARGPDAEQGKRVAVVDGGDTHHYTNEDNRPPPFPPPPPPLSTFLPTSTPALHALPRSCFGVRTCSVGGIVDPGGQAPWQPGARSAGGRRAELLRTERVPRWAGTSAPPLPPSATTPEAATASVPTEGPPTDAGTADHHRGLDSPAAQGPPVTRDPLQLHPEVLVGGVSALKWRGRWEWESGHLLEPLVASLPGPRPSGRPPLGPASPPPGTPGLAASPRHLRWWVTWVASSIGDGRREAHRGARPVEWAKRMARGGNGAELEDPGRRPGARLARLGETARPAFPELRAALGGSPSRSGRAAPARAGPELLGGGASVPPAAAQRVVVITFASHAKGPRFETGRKHASLLPAVSGSCGRIGPPPGAGGRSAGGLSLRGQRAALQPPRRLLSLVTFRAQKGKGSPGSRCGPWGPLGVLGRTRPRARLSAWGRPLRGIGQPVRGPSRCGGPAGAGAQPVRGPSRCGGRMARRTEETEERVPTKPAFPGFSVSAATTRPRLT
ncbi:nascent polypeptide-associated complex subunit alpha, muscle-specific form-like [Mustela putorius furo]|uniref:Nascent polypeptide-associated complex subunit alpha, muscle-specific form-like n=1 Tax=Mustela putorius furo TaxID=9669 RepID=A0A8U0SGV9_MUSPF|nr:nascent polypeptide-associated complex subunit alpha, muscle-specific form-like [Mustela putorius furo]